MDGQIASLMGEVDALVTRGVLLEKSRDALGDDAFKVGLDDLRCRVVRAAKALAGHRPAISPVPEVFGEAFVEYLGAAMHDMTLTADERDIPIKLLYALMRLSPAD